MNKPLCMLLALTMIACNQPEKFHKLVTITGNIANPKTDHVFIKGVKEIKSTVVDSIYVDKNGDYVIGFAVIDNEGNFRMSFEINEPNSYKFIHGKSTSYFFIAEGDSIHIDLDAEEFVKTIAYSGSGAQVNNFMVSRALLRKKLAVNDRKLYALELDEFQRRIDTIRNTLDMQLAAFLDTVANVPGEIAEYIGGNNFYIWVYQRLSYPEYHKYLTKTDTVDLGEDYDAYLTDIDLNNPDLLRLRSYTGSLAGYLNKKAEGEFEKDSSLKEMDKAQEMVRFRLIKELVDDEKVKNYLYYSILNTVIKKSGIYKIEPLMAEFEKQCTNRQYKVNIKKEYGKWEALAEGNPAPQFAFPNIGGDTVALSDFRGKYVYVDVWATWCGPCKKEIPHLEKLQEEFKNENIVFMSVSVDNTKSPWENMVGSKNMKGIQLFAEGWESSIVKDYKIKGIPRFILIDPEGMIINVKAPRPSGGIRDVLKKLEGIDREALI